MKTLIVLLVTLSFASDLPLRGEGSYTWFFLDIYEAKLWASKGKDIYTGALKLELTYQRDFKGLDISKQSEKEMRSQGISEKLLKKWRPIMDDVFPDVKVGDRILASYNPKLGVKFYHNEKKLIGHFRDEGLSKSFLNIWLGERSSDQVLRKKLLGDI